MCGIAGWYPRRSREGLRAAVADQCDAIFHRGPDDGGLFLAEDRLGIGMRRLSIVDLAGGHQPMQSPDGRHVIVFNGEIYNHRALRPALEAAGHRFTTHSDTETLLAAYRQWGDDAWLKLEGMYGVAIWDNREQTLTLARDPLGIKPLYVTEQDGGLAFASELRALTVLPDLAFDVDPRAVHDYFRFGHIQRPRSIYRQVRQLEPGHVLRIGATGKARIHCFWRPRLHLRHGLSEADWIAETRDRLLATVDAHLLADVPVGVFLSGGVDSSAIAAAMTRVSNARATAFTIGFPGHKSDETSAAEAIARHLGLEHIVMPVDLARARDAVPEIVADLDEPLGASAVIPCWYVSRLAAQHVKVVLCGEGGDELFAGYKRQRNALRMQQWRPLIAALRPLTGALEKLPATDSRRWNYIRQQIRRVSDSARLTSGFQRFLTGTQISQPGLRDRLFAPDLAGDEDVSIAGLESTYFDDPDWRAAGMVEQFMLGDLGVHMPGALLPRLDRTSMAHSLEARVPLLTHQFVDWALGIPVDFKIRQRGKHVLREAVRPWLPEGILDRRKQGFQMPVADWFMGDLADFTREIWHDGGAAAAGYLDNTVIDSLIADHRAGKANHGKILYAITVFGCWWQQRAHRTSPVAGVPRRDRMGS